MEIRGFSHSKKQFVSWHDVQIEIDADEKENLSKLSEYGYIPYNPNIHPQSFCIPGPWNMHTIISVSTIMVNSLYGLLAGKITMSNTLIEARWKLECIPLLRVVIDHDVDRYRVMYITALFDCGIGIYGYARCQSLLCGSVNCIYKSIKDDEQEMKIIKDLATTMRHDLRLADALMI